MISICYEHTGGPDRSATGAACKRKSLETALGALTARQWLTRTFGNFSAALALSACATPPGDCLLVDHVVYSCEEVR